MIRLLLLKNVLLYLLILITGLYAGMLFFHEMCPVETKLNPLQYAAYWKIVDGSFMHRRMGIMGPLMIGLFLVNILFHVKERKSLHFIFLFCSFMVFVMDVGFTINNQLPINEYINRLDLDHINEHEHMQLISYQSAAIKNFKHRFLFGILSFALLCIVPLSHKRNSESVS